MSKEPPFTGNDPFSSETEIEDFINYEYADKEDLGDNGAGDAYDSNTDTPSPPRNAGDAHNERAEEFAFIMLLLLLKVSLFFIIQYCEENGYNATLFEVIQF